MKKFLYLSILLALFNTMLIFSQWEKVGNFDRLTFSESVIKQIEVCDSTNSLYVLDTNYTLKRINIESGQVVWSRELRNAHYPEGTFMSAQIGRDAKNYAIILEGNGRYIFYIKDIYTDSLIAKLDYKFPEYPGSIVEENVTCELSEKYFFLQLDFEAWQGYDTEITGYLILYKIEKDTLVQISSVTSGRGTIIMFPFSNTAIGRFWIFWSTSIGGKYRSEESWSFFSYDLKTWSTIGIPLGDDISRIQFFSISQEPLLVWVKINDTIRVYEKELKKYINFIKFSENVGCMINSINQDLLFLGSNKKIFVFVSKSLIPLDTIETPANGAVNILRLSSNDEFLYFVNNNEIYRFKTSFKDIPPKLHFIPYPKELLVGNSVEFLNYSSGKFDEIMWDFGDGNKSTEWQPKHIYYKYGIFQVVLVAKKGNQTFVATDTVIVSPKLSADFQFVVDWSVCPIFVKFNNTSLGVIDSLFWDFGDGTTSREFKPIHYYYLGGKYTVKLKIYGMKSVSETSKDIFLKAPESYSLSQGFKNELVFKPSIGKTEADAFVIPNGNIIVRTESKLFSVDKFGNVLWEKKETYNKIMKCPYSNYFIAYNYLGNFIVMWDFNGNIIKKFSEPDGARIVNVGFKGGKIYFSSYTKNFDCDFHMPTPHTYTYSYTLYFTILDLNFKIIWRKQLENDRFYQPEGSDEYLCWYFNYFAIPNESGEPESFLCANFLFFKYTTDSNTGSEWHKVITNGSIFKLNGVPYSSNFKMYNYDSTGSGVISAIELINDSTLIFLSPPDFLITVNVNSFVFKRIKIPFLVPNTILKINDTCFVVPAKSLNHNEIGFGVFNHNCELLDTFFIQCRFGSVKSLTITPEREILLAGIRNIYKDTSFVFLVSTDLPFIRDIIGYKLSAEQQSKPQDLHCSPNLTDGFFIVEFEPTPNKLKVELFDIMGNRLKVLFDGFWSESNMFVDISDLPQGIYFLKATCGNSVRYYKIYNTKN